MQHLYTSGRPPRGKRAPSIAVFPRLFQTHTLVSTKNLSTIRNSCQGETRRKFGRFSRSPSSPSPSTPNTVVGRRPPQVSARGRRVRAPDQRRQAAVAAASVRPRPSGARNHPVAGKEKQQRKRGVLVCSCLFTSLFVGWMCALPPYVRVWSVAPGLFRMMRALVLDVSIYLPSFTSKCLPASAT